MRMSTLVIGAILIIAICYVFWRLWQWSINPRGCWHGEREGHRPNVWRALNRPRLVSRTAIENDPFPVIDVSHIPEPTSSEEYLGGHADYLPEDQDV